MMRTKTVLVFMAATFCLAYLPGTMGLLGGGGILSDLSSRLRGGSVATVLSVDALQAGVPENPEPEPEPVPQDSPSTTGPTGSTPGSAPGSTPTTPPPNPCSAIDNCASCVDSGSAGAISCTSCNAGYAVVPGGTICRACSEIAGCTECTVSPEGDLNCDRCASGRTVNAQTDTECISCAQIARCVACIDRQAVDDGDDDSEDLFCTQCSPGSEEPSGESCT